MQAILNLIESGDIFSLLVLATLLYLIGDRMVYQQAELQQGGLRLAAVALVGYCIYAGLELHTSEPMLWVGIVFRGLLAAALTLGVSWIVLAFYGFLKRVSKRVASNARTKADDKRRQQERQRKEQERLKQEQEYDRGESERQRMRQLEQARKLQAAHAQQLSQQQRDDIRYSCELFFNRHAPVIAERFTREDLQQFFAQYMHDNLAPDVVQRRANQLLDTIREHVDVVNPPEQMTTLEDIANWFTKQKLQIESLDVNPMIKDEYLVRLRERYGELSERMMESIQP